MIAGIDFGTVRIGIALAEERVGIATPLATYLRAGEQTDARYFRGLVESQQIDRFVVGLPVHLDGGESQNSSQARQFGKWINEVTGVTVEYFDERFTSVQADELLAGAALTKKKRKARRDQLAAQILLTAYLESGQRNDPDPGAIDG